MGVIKAQVGLSGAMFVLVCQNCLLMLCVCVVNFFRCSIDIHSRLAKPLH